MGQAAHRNGTRTPSWAWVQALALVLALGGPAHRAHALPLDDEEDMANAVRAKSFKISKVALAKIQEAEDVLEQVKKKYGADSDEYKSAKKAVDDAIHQINTDLNKNQRVETAKIKDLHTDRLRELKVLHDLGPPALCCVTGDLQVDGVSQTSHFGEGDEVTLSFRLIDPLTDLPFTSGPPISSVLFRVNRDPLAPTVFDTIAVSTDASHAFETTFTIDSYEPLFEAIPLDAAGAPIFLAGVDGENAARAFVVNIPDVPEPATWALMLLGLGGVGAMARSRRRSGAAAKLAG